MPDATTERVTIHYAVDGPDDAEPLLLVMGLGMQLVDWPAGFVAALVDEGFRVIRPDNRDAGLSTAFDWEPPSRFAIARSLLTKRPVDAGYRLADMADDSIGVLDHLGVGSAHLVGASMGGMIVQELAIRAPGRTRSLTSIMSNTGDRRNGGASPKLIWKLVRAPEVTRENAVERGVEMGRLISGPGFDESRARSMAEAAVERSFRPDGVDRQAAAIAASPDRTEALGRVEAPSLVIHGLVDPLVRPSGGEATAAAIPGSRLLALPDMGHDLPESRWGEIAAAIRANAERAAPARAVV